MYLIAESWWLVPANIIALGKAAFGLGVVIFVHELGHFLVAKACGVKCEKFYVGFDVPLQFGPIKLPAALWKKKVGETEYGIGMIPLGGYVKMLGQDDNPANAAAEAERIRVAQEGGEKYELDPRSYPAKTVPQRMAIISAGVIMNLIFAVLFAAAAYMMGLTYTPAIVGSTMPGESAWQAGMRPGDHMLRLGKDGRRDEQLRFRDLRFSVIKSDEQSFDVLVRRLDGSEHNVSVRPVARKGEYGGLAKIGVLSLSSNKVHKFDYDDGSVAHRSDLKKGDTIRQVVVDGQTHEVDDSLTLRRVMLAHPDKSLTLVVDRSADPEDKESAIVQQSIELAPEPASDLGFHATMGPIIGLQDGSPADAAGFMTGDILQAIDGQPIEDPLLVDDMLHTKIGTATTITVARGAETLDLTVTPRPLDMFGEAGRLGGPVAAVTIGVAYDVVDTIAAIRPGGPAEMAGLEVGDKIIGMEFVRNESSDLEPSLIKSLRLNVPFEFKDDQGDWAFAYSVSQNLPVGMDVKLTCSRGTENVTAVMTPIASNVAWNAKRGLVLEMASRTRTASSISDAFSLGLRETKESVMQVFVTLQRIGKLFKHLGGPVTIAYAATSEASEGLPRLLAFLTLLSANLAVLNFLPIPVLDGGHMMFLIYEGVFGKPMNERIAFAATMVGLCFILGLMLFVIGMDVFRFSGLLGLTG